MLLHMKRGLESVSRLGDPSSQQAERLGSVCLQKELRPSIVFLPLLSPEVQVPMVAQPRQLRT